MKLKIPTIFSILNFCPAITITTNIECFGSEREVFQLKENKDNYEKSQQSQRITTKTSQSSTESSHRAMQARWTSSTTPWKHWKQSWPKDWIRLSVNLTRHHRRRRKDPMSATIRARICASCASISRMRWARNAGNVAVRVPDHVQICDFFSLLCCYTRYINSQHNPVMLFIDSAILISGSHLHFTYYSVGEFGMCN